MCIRDSLCIDEVFDEVGSISENVRDQCSPFWLARAISEATAAKFRSEGYEEKWRSDRFELHGPLKRNHKEESFDFGAEACYVKQCNSVRPAFVLEAHREDVVIELMYVYIPMGLERQHDIQSSVLARFCSHELASCFLAVASEELGIGYVGDACTCIIPETALKSGGRHEIVR